jgi:hypothetical protein
MLSSLHTKIAQTGGGLVRVVVTGGRFYDDYSRLAGILDEIHTNGWIPEAWSLNHDHFRFIPPPITLIAHGACEYGGTDELAGYWADANGVRCSTYPAKRHPRTGRLLGSARNSKMLVMVNPHLVIATPGGHGTLDCIKKARSQRKPVLEIDRGP